MITEWGAVVIALTGTMLVGAFMCAVDWVFSLFDKKRIRRAKELLKNGK